MSEKLKNAIITLKSALNEDKSEGSYYYSWQSNIAMAFVDEWEKWSKEVVGRNATPDHKVSIANEAAKRFLDLFINND